MNLERARWLYENDCGERIFSIRCRECRRSMGQVFDTADGPLFVGRLYVGKSKQPAPGLSAHVTESARAVGLPIPAGGIPAAIKGKTIATIVCLLGDADDELLHVRCERRHDKDGTVILDRNALMRNVKSREDAFV
jgi:hypothetical protein